MKRIKKIAAIILSIALMLLVLVGCNSDNTNEKDTVLLKIDFQSYNPTFNTTPTAENPIVVQSTKMLADAFMKENPEIKIEFDYSKSNSATKDETSQWYINGIATNNLPAISYSWGTTFQDRDYYLDLTDYFEQPNPYEKDNVKWKDIFYDNIFYQNTIMNAKGQIVAIPITCSPGGQTGIYYNKDYFKPPYGDKADGYDFPTSWETMINVANQITNSREGIGFVNWPVYNTVTLNHWFINQNLAPSLISANDSRYHYDFDGDGNVTTMECLRGVKAGLYNPQTNDVARELYRQAKRYFTTSGDYKGPLISSWQDTDYSAQWAKGGVAMFEDGAWSYQTVLNQAGRNYNFGYAQPFQILKDTTPLAPEVVQLTEKGPISPICNFMLNINKSVVKDNPALLDAAIKFMQYVTTTESLSLIAEESGSVLGAGKNCTHSKLLDPILNERFPILMQAGWPLGFTTSCDDKIDRTFIQWLDGSMSDENFYNLVNKYQNEGADAYIKAMDIDTKGW